MSFSIPSETEPTSTHETGNERHQTLSEGVKLIDHLPWDPEHPDHNEVVAGYMRILALAS